MSLMQEVSFDRDVCRHHAKRQRPWRFHILLKTAHSALKPNGKT